MLWLSGHNWDDPVDNHTLLLWTDFRQQLPQLEQLWIPRWFGTDVNSPYALHGFSDASEKAYAAAVYVIVNGEDGLSKSTLIAAKSKVAPLKTVSLPRLELCGALLLVKLIHKIQLDLGNPTVPVFCWTDSQVVLAWLKSSPHHWKTFVANRVSEILTLLPEAQWNHVRSALNPADYATRGLAPEQLQHNQLWWNGPQKLFEKSGPRSFPMDCETVLEKRTTTATFHISVSAGADGEDFIRRFSSLRWMLRVTALLRRWLPEPHSTSGQTTASIISAREIQAARTRLISTVQSQHFAKEIALLQEGRALQRSSTLRRLLPFLDSDGLLRVGGRLQHAFLTPTEKHPVIIPKESWFSDLLIKDAHLVTLHGGLQLTHSHLLRQCWIPRARTKIRRLCRECVRCCRFQGRTIEQRMAPLPTERVTPSRPFNVTGVDYAGPFAVRTSKGRGQRSSKGYIVIFTCFVTRAVHIEVASDYTSKTFLLAFKRFVSRRGLCHQLYSDNGTMFQGADSELRRNFEESSVFSTEVAEAIQADGVSWSFIPPRASHFGGLWEAAVKSFKHHLKRVVGEAKLTFEEFSTLAASIEACLNSRPLNPLSSDPEDVAALTPGHFLVGSALTAPPEPPTTCSSVTGVPRWRIVSQMQLHFWVRSQKEVLYHLQQRSKWLAATDQPAVGDLVLLTDDLQPPLKWPLARITILHPGADGLVRVATLRTATTSLKRPLTKFIQLPIDTSAADHLAFQDRDQSAVNRSSL